MSSVPTDRSLGSFTDINVFFYIIRPSDIWNHLKTIWKTICRWLNEIPSICCQNPKGYLFLYFLYIVKSSGWLTFLYNYFASQSNPLNPDIIRLPIDVYSLSYLLYDLLFRVMDPLTDRLYVPNLFIFWFYAMYYTHIGTHLVYFCYYCIKVMRWKSEWKVKWERHILPLFIFV